MINYHPKNWFKLIFEFHKSDTFRSLLWVLILIAVYAFAVVYIEINYRGDFHSTILVHSLLGYVIGLLLVFRTNTAYERWWEGRKQWGALVNSSRNFSMQINAILPKEDKDNREFFDTMIRNYVYALKDHLRDSKNSDVFVENKIFQKSILNNKEHWPNYIASLMHEKVQELYRKDIISGDQLIVLDKELKSFTDILGACERIKNTPIPYSYNMFIKKFIFVYVITLPFGLVSDFQYWAIPITIFLLYVLGSMELLAEEIEDPFGTDANDLPTDELCTKIKINVKEIFSEKA
jgi:putative membrane protein